jgi:hypothetical protein
MPLILWPSHLRMRRPKNEGEASFKKGSDAGSYPSKPRVPALWFFQGLQLGKPNVWKWTVYDIKGLKINTK